MPKEYSNRVVRKYARFPKRMAEGNLIWLGYYYSLQNYREKRHSSDWGSDITWVEMEATQCKGRMEKFLRNQYN